MRNNRKWLVFLLAAVLLVNTFGVGAAAAENGSPLALSVSPAVEAGAAVTVQVLATQSGVVADGELVLTYDPALLSYVSTAAGDAWSAQEPEALSVNAVNGTLKLVFANVSYADTGVLFTLTFTAKEACETVVSIDGSSYITGVEADLAAEASSCPSAKFVDVANLSNEAHAAVDYMLSKGYMNGMSQTMFGPHVDLNRAMMVTILYRIAGSPAVEGTPAFTDVPTNAFYTEAVLWATENGITNGVSANLFAPGKSLTRQELVTFLYRFASMQGMDVSASADLSGYTDADVVRPYARPAFEWAVANGIIKGTTATTLSPEATTTRAQVCLMVYRMLSAQD